MIDKKTLRLDIDDAVSRERTWKDYYNKQDHGSYCEKASYESCKSWDVVKAYRDLFTALLHYERS